MGSVNVGWLRSPSCPPRPLLFKIFFATFVPPLRSSRLKALPSQSIVFFNYCGPAIAAIRFRHSFLTLAGGVAMASRRTQEKFRADEMSALLQSADFHDERLISEATRARAPAP